MKRPLEQTERTMTEKGIIKLNAEIKDLQILQEIKVFHRDKIVPYNRKTEDKNIKDELEYLEEQVKAKEFSVKEMHKHLKEGVEVKSNSAVK